MLLIDETVAEGIISSDCKGPKSFAAHSCKLHLSFGLVLNGENYFVAMASLVENPVVRAGQKTGTGRERAIYDKHVMF